MSSLVLTLSHSVNSNDRTITLNGKITFQQSQGDEIKQPASVELESYGESPKSLEFIRGSGRDLYSNYVRIDENGDKMVYTFYRNISGFESNGEATNIVFKGRRVVFAKTTFESVFQGERLKVSDEDLAKAGMTFEK